MFLRRTWRVAIALAISSLFLAGAAAGPGVADSGTVQFVFDGNRVYAPIAFILPGGALRQTLAFVDPGSPSMLVSPDLYRELGAASSPRVTFRIGDLPVSVDARAVARDSWFPFRIGGRGTVEALLPAGVMRDFQVRYDYEHRALTLAKPGTFAPEGIAVPLRIDEKTGLAAIDATIEGETRPITIDNGSGYTWIRKSSAQPWLTLHPEWVRGIGAVGPSNMRMVDDAIEATGELVRFPQVRFGDFEVRNLGALVIGRDKHGQDFMDWYSTKNAVPVMGWIGGNVLRAYRLTMDYPRRMSYWVKRSDIDSSALDYVGVSLAQKKGDYFIAAIAAQNGKPTVEGVQVGDRLIQIGKTPVNGASREAIFAAMHGKPGERRLIVVERNGKRLRVETTITAF